MTVAAAARQTFAALAIPNYRRYYAGQAVSLVGTWMQTVAQSWLVLQLTHSATSIGLVVALQTLPILLLGPYGGVIADRVDKRRLMVGLQSMMGLLALVLGLLTVTNNVTLWQVYVLALLLGLNNTFENPARQSFILEMVGPKDLRNAVTLNSVLVNAARAIGPAFAGVIIAAGGTGVCFLVNAASFAAVVFSLVTLNRSQLSPSKPTGRRKGQLLEGLRYVRRTPNLAVPLLMMGLVGCLGYEFQVVLPVLASDTFHGGARTYGFMTATMGIGAVLGGLYAAAKGRIGLRSMSLSAAVFGSCFLTSALAPDLAVELVSLALLGAASVTFLSKGNSTLQLTSTPQMRGRVMALWSVAFMGSTPIGGPIAGAVEEHLGARAGLLLGAVACLIATILGALTVRRLGRTGAPATPETPETPVSSDRPPALPTPSRTAPAR